MYDELKKLYDSDIYPMHMPGHKRRDGFGQIKNALEIDITEIVGYDDLYEPEGFIKEALKRAAELYKAEHTMFLVNGSTVGILASVFAATKPCGRILIARNCHKSVYHAAALRELKAEYIFPSQKDGMFESIDPKEVEDKLKSADFDAVIITSPTYEGKVSDIEKIAHICHENKAALIVDEAHGAHFGFHDRFPKSAVGAADLVVMSTHKTLPTLTQTGLLHVNDEYYEKVTKYLQMFQTSSPSYLLMSSIDSCLSKIKESGSRLWEDFFTYRDAFTKRMDKLKHLKYIETDDPCKIVIS
ncbi:MAG: aminotransferase class V-fold PLP-dependent enzyme, partial [Lachnospiraceae bacterium]|nr:aminotransferase class V-fold PLP-dependent enzyme [Lachnospiraceae bacterium]